MDDQMDFPSDQVDALPEEFGDETGVYARRPVHTTSQKQVPKLTTPVASDCYNMNHARQGTAIIFNNKKFDPRTGYGERNGTDKDAENLYMALTEMGFNTFIYADCTRQEMQAKMNKVATDDHSDADCFMCAILSHGDEGSVYGYDGPVKMEDLVTPLKGNNCPTLAGKPKIFFIQACRGMKLDEGVDVEVADAIGVSASDAQEMDLDIPVIRRIPTEADFLMAYSVASGFYAWRNLSEGSWFIQAVCQVLRENWKRMDLLSMMTRVCKKVAFEFESCNADTVMRGKKQVPCITSMLTRDVYFTPKK